MLVPYIYFKKKKFLLFYRRNFLLVIILIFNVFQTKSQDDLLTKIIVFQKLEVHISDILQKFAREGINFSYKNNVNVEDKLVTLKKKEVQLKDVLELLTQEHQLIYKVVRNHIIINPLKQKLYTVSGFVYSSESGEQLIAANIYDPNTFKGTTTNNYGFYSLSRSGIPIKIKFAYIGYKSQEIYLYGASDTIINIHLEPDNLLNEIVVNDEKSSFIESSMVSNHRLSSKSMALQTLFFGEKDVLKTIQLLPGIQPVIEGSTGLQVRGGSHSQNLIIIDDVPIYNIDHAFGFFSIFNADAIKSAQIIKGAFPAKYGGRVSSVVDIRMNEGNNYHLQFEFSTGILLSKFKIEAPILKGKTSFMISARRTHLGLPLMVIPSENDANGTESFSFSDIYTKLNHKFSDRSRIYLSLFYGMDKYKTQNELNADSTSLSRNYKSDLNWHNFATALRWNYLISDKLFCNSSLTYSGYKYSHKINEMEEYINSSNAVAQNIKDTNYYNSVKDIGLKLDLESSVNEYHVVSFGVNSSMNIYQPFMEGSLLMVSKESKNPLLLPVFDITYDTITQFLDLKSYSLSAYIEDDINISKKLEAKLGLRYNYYFNNNKAINNIEPRISFRYLILPNLALKAGYSRMSQNTHLLSSSFLVLPFNIWVPSTERVKPLLSDQYSISCNFSFPKLFDISIEGFYKTISNDILYKNGNRIINTWEDLIEQGERRSYGLEVMINKQVGKFTGWCTYTLSKTERKFESVNEGEYFPYWLVRKHKISATLNLKIYDQIDLSASWVYSSSVSGNSGYQELAPIFFQQPAKIQSTHRDSWTLTNKIPAYHKLDLGLNFHRQIRKLKHTLTIGVNNAYARNNPLLISEFEGYLYLSKINLFMPFLQYSLKFN